MSSSSSEVDRRAVPDEATALLTIKIGDVSRTSRKHLTILTFGFLLSEGLDVFRAKVDACTDKALENFCGDPHVREDPALYMRPGAHSKQAELVEITSNNFENRVARSYKNYLKRKTEDNFQCEVYVYVKKVVAPRRRRSKDTTEIATDAALQEDFVQTQQLDSGELSGPAVAPSSKRKRSIGSEGSVEQSQSYQPVQGLHIDGGYYRTVRMVINGVVVPVQVNVQDLLLCFTSFQQSTALGTETHEEAEANGFQE
ncbi:hypothetical protein P3T76_010977 [Phytophthora citrophthora]|uniref:Uncharacterized protein n=1 Tax=Phytophthora citrophthora TaxID=4793 RepID=A0AAD9LG85_9STRA|nr:hypothetical protein P3T76_010977 [Phytophthora citrophthora]